MKTQKIIVISLLTILILTVATIAAFMLKPQMHKTIQIEQIIFKKVK